MKFEEKLMKLRKEKGWSQEELAEKLNVTRQTISKWELGQTVPDMYNLTKIAEVFGTTVSELYYEKENTEDVNNLTENNIRYISILDNYDSNSSNISNYTYISRHRSNGKR